MILPLFQKLKFLGSYILPSLKGISSRNSGQLQSGTCICNAHSIMHVISHLNAKRLNHVPSSLTRRDKWPASCPRAPTYTPPLHSAAIALSLASRSCVARPDHGYQQCTLVPPRRSHPCQSQSVPNPPHELDLEYIPGAWRRKYLVDT